ncbi:hypothetical protein VCHENC02_3284, partial [Vibrio harveyi]
PFRILFSQTHVFL